MADKEVKAFLKEAREQIKNKDFKSALKECKKVLNKDKNNYMALVFCGLCLSELDQPDQALQAYKRAADANPDQPVAWEGLQKFYEKQKTSSTNEHYLEVLKKLIEFYGEDFNKYFDISNKLAQLQLENQDLAGSITTLRNQAEKAVDDQEKHKEANASIIKVLTSQTSLNDEYNVYLLDALEIAVNDNQTPTNMENLKHLIKHYYKMKLIPKLVATAQKMIQIFPENIYPLEWICKVYLEWTANIWSVEDEDVFGNIEMYFTALKSFSESNSLAILAKGAFHYNQKSLSECVEVLKSATNNSSPNFFGLYILCLAYVDLRDESNVEVSAAEALKYSSKVKGEDKRRVIVSFLNMTLLQSLYNQLSVEKVKKAMDVIPNCDLESAEVLCFAAKVYATLGFEGKAKDILTKYGDRLNPHTINLIHALLLKSQGKFGESIELMQNILTDSPDEFEATVLLAQMLFDRGEKEQSFALFLKSAKLNPTHWLPFFYLGKHYEDQGSDASVEKARKCYQKCLQLSGSNNVEAAISLSDILRRLGKHQENLSLLSQVTKEAGARGGCTWAWLRLGVHHLTSDQPGLAVTSLQSALRSSPENVTCWEALGDAYMARGSYVAARKAFEKVLTLNSESVYSKLMIADIKQKLGYHQDAINDYDTLLQSAPEYLPALRGLGETFLALAEVHLQQFVDKNVLDCIEKSMSALTRAAVIRPGMAGTWRLLGEAASLASHLPESVVSVRVPVVLVRTEAGPDDTDTCDRSSLLDLSVRCYTKCLVLDQDNVTTWHDLALVQASLNQLDTAVLSLKKAISLNPRQSQCWVSLGLIYTKQENWAQAQHCFIKGIELDNTAQCWTNLGVVYLNLGEQGLANKAFKEAQNTEPDYIRGWTGQALLAEVAGVKSECMDLFRHCTFLGPEPESARGYSDWVCSTIEAREAGHKVEPHNKYILDKMFGVSVGVDSLTSYTRRYPEDVTALCQLGVLAEKKGLVRTAQEAMVQALSHVTDQSEKDKILTNLGRLLTKLGNYEAAVTSYMSVSSPSLYSGVGLAMAHYKLGNYQDSYQAYDSCLHWLTSDDQDGLKSHILVAMGNLAYKVEGMEAAKTLLFRSCQLTPPSVRGLFALCVIGVQHSDMNLIEAALSEMQPHEQDPRFATDIAFLRASIFVLKGDVAGARRSLLTCIHRQPWLAKLWSSLSLFLLQNCPRDARAAARLSAKAGVMRQGCVDQDQGRVEEEGVDTEVVATVALMMSGDRELSIKRASRACHLYPHLAESWAVLVAAARMGTSPATSATWLPRVVSHVSRLGAGNSSLTDWAARVAASL